MERFRYQAFRRNDVSGLPYGFWFGWGPRDGKRYEPTTFKWHVGFYWYPWWKFAEPAPRLPRFHFSGEGPIGA